MTLTDATGLAASGGVWVGPNGAGQGWEQVHYGSVSGSDLEDLQREPSPPVTHNQLHSVGAVVRPFLPITSDNGQLHLQWTADENGLVTTWTATVGGVLAPESILRNQRLCIVQVRDDPTAAFRNLLVGFLDSPRIRDDHARRGEWTVQVMSVAGLLAQIDLDGLRVGDYDLALAGSTESNTPLPSVAAYKVRHTGDFTAANPEFGSDNVITPDAAAPWMSDIMVGSVETPPQDGAAAVYNGISQIYMNPPYAAGGGLKWIEIVNRVTSGSILVVYDPVTATEYQTSIPSLSLNHQETLIVVEDEDRFREHNPSSSPTRLYDIRDSSFDQWFEHVNPAGGALAFKSFDQYQNLVLWGTQTAAPGGWGLEGGGSPYASGSIAAPAFDYTLHYDFPQSAELPSPGLDGDRNENMQAEFWSVGKFQNPGYIVRDDGDDAYLAVFTPTLGLRLRDDITDSAPGVAEILYIVNDSGPSVDGLPASGDVWIAEEKISYSAKSGVEGVVVSARGTTPAAHLEGDALFPDFEGEPVDCPPIASIVWERFRVDGGAPIVPADFVVRVSSQDARTPDQHLHENDYQAAVTYTGNTAASATIGVIEAGRYIKTILFEFQVMSADPSRPRMNRVKALAHEDFYDATRWMPGTQTVYAVANRLLLNAGVPAGAIVDGTGTVNITQMETAKDKAFAVLRDLALLTNSRVTVGLDSKITIAPDVYWPAATRPTPDLEYDAEDVASYEQVRTRGGNVKQVRIEWVDTSGDAGDTVIFPATEAWQGDILELAGHIFVDSDAADAAAARRFYTNRYPFTSVLELADGSLDVAPLQFAQVTWESGAVVAGDSLPDDVRLYLAIGVDVKISDGILSTVITGKEIERESPWLIG
jgi:hypothetical protein